MTNKIEARDYVLRSMPFAQCRVRIGYDAETKQPVIVKLISYSTTILACFSDGGMIKCLITAPVNYSRTTARHVNRFTKELFGDSKYFDMKGAETYFTDNNGRFESFCKQYGEYGKCKF